MTDPTDEEKRAVREWAASVLRPGIEIFPYNEEGHFRVLLWALDEAERRKSATEPVPIPMFLSCPACNTAE